MICDAPTSNSSIRYLFFNANGLKNRLDNINLFTQTNHVNISIIVETHQTSHHLNNMFLSIPCYKGTSGGTIGGIVGFSSHQVQTKILEQNQYYALLEFQNQSLLAVCYFPPSMANFKSHILSLFESIRIHSNNFSNSFHIVGDFNARHLQFGDHTSLSRGNELLSIIQDFPIKWCAPQIGNFTTINTSGGKGVTDLLLSSDDTSIFLRVYEEESLGGSDHRPLVWDSNDFNLHQESNRIKWNWKLFKDDHTLQNLYQQYLSDTFPIDLFSNNIHLLTTSKTNYIDSVWTSIVTWITNSLQNCCGKAPKFRNHSGMFWTPELLEQSKLVDKASNSIHTTSESFLEKGILFRRYAANRAKRHDEINRNFLDSLYQSKDRNAFFKFVKRSSRSRAQSALLENDIDLYADYFKTTFGSYPKGSTSLIDNAILLQTLPFGDQKEDAPFTVNECDIENTLKYMAFSKAAGEDELPAEAFKYGGHIIASVLSQFYNLLLEYQIAPSQWSNSLLIPIYKKKGSIDQIQNYRPISLTIVAKRIFERIIDSKLDVYKSKLHNLQGGFRKGRSTVHQIYYLEELLKSNPNMINVYLDLRAAYDTVDRRILWTQLVHDFGMPTNLVKTIRSLMDFNTTFIVVGRAKSNGISNFRGLPQGSSLAPLLFNFFINSLIVNLERTTLNEKLVSNCLFFADDSNIHANNSSDAQRLLQICDDWASNHGMSFAPEKCFVVAKEKNISLQFGGQILTQVNQTKYLGIEMNDHGANWKQIAIDFSTKAKNSIMALIKAGFNKNGWCASAKIKVYKLFIRPLMEYGMQIHLYGQKDIELFEKTQQLALRIAFRFKNCS